VQSRPHDTFHLDSPGIARDSVRVKLGVAILNLELAREHTDDAQARAALDAALRAAWGAAHLLYDRA
jgi:hypothetical protein